MVGVTHSVLYLAVGVRLPTGAETLRDEISRVIKVMVQLESAVLEAKAAISSIVPGNSNHNRHFVCDESSGFLSTLARDLGDYCSQFLYNIICLTHFHQIRY